MKIANYAGTVVLGLSLWGLSFDTVTLAQGEKKAAHYALENYAVYANSPMNAEEQRGYHEGFTQGQKQAKTNIGPNPLKTKYYRNGPTRYREAFLQGYMAGYHQKMKR